MRAAQAPRGAPGGGNASTPTAWPVFPAASSHVVDTSLPVPRPRPHFEGHGGAGPSAARLSAAERAGASSPSLGVSRFSILST